MVHIPLFHSVCSDSKIAEAAHTHRTTTRQIYFLRIVTDLWCFLPLHLLPRHPGLTGCSSGWHWHSWGIWSPAGSLPACKWGVWSGLVFHHTFFEHNSSASCVYLLVLIITKHDIGDKFSCFQLLLSWRIEAV